jgi:uncharacterized coiled-coil protein SlyX
VDEPVIASPASGAPGTPDDLDRRLARLEHRVGEAVRTVETLAPLVAALRDVVGDQLVRLQADVRRTGTVVDAFSARLDAEIAARSEQAESLGGRPADRALTALEEAADAAIAAAHRVAARADEERDQIQTVLDSALRRIESAPAGGGADDTHRALGDLGATVQGALAAQANRIEQLLAGLRAELGRQEAPAPPDLTDLEGRIDAWRADTARQSDLFAQFVGRLDDGLDALKSTAEEVAARVADGMEAAIADQHATVRAALDDLREATVAAAAAIDTAAAEAASELRRQSTVAAARIDEQGTSAADAIDLRIAGAREQVDRLVTSLTGLERVFLGYLEDHDRRAAIERADLVRQFVEQLAAGLTRRERRRLARKLEIPDVAEEVDEDVAERLREVVSRSASASFPLPPERREAPLAKPPVSPPRAPAEPVSAPSPPTSTTALLGGVTSSAGSAGSARADVAVAAIDPPPTPATTRPVATTAPLPAHAGTSPVEGDEGHPDPPRVQASRRKRPVRDRSSRPGDPAHVRRALAGVRGLGPAKQSALIDRFGTLEAIRAATDGELLALPGIGPSLVTAIREALD